MASSEDRGHCKKHGPQLSLFTWLRLTLDESPSNGPRRRACIGKDYAYFEPVHGSAPDIAGKNIANPTAMILTAVWMLDYLGFERETDRLEDAVRKVYAGGKYLTADMGGKTGTKEFAAAVKANL